MCFDDGALVPQPPGELTHAHGEQLVLTSADGTTFYRSPSIAKMLGWSPEEMEGRIWADSIFPEDLERFRGEVEGLVRRGERDLALEFRAWHRDGSVRSMEGTGRRRNRRQFS